MKNIDLKIVNDRKISKTGNAYHIILPSALIEKANFLDIKKKYNIIFEEIVDNEMGSFGLNPAIAY